MMTMNKRRQKRINRKYAYIFIANLVIAIVIMFTAMVIEARENNKIEDEVKPMAHESDDHVTITLSANTSTEELVIVEEEIVKEENEITGRNLTDDEKYLLAKIAMAEAEGESLETKILVILTILNRVESDVFPNTIKEVIFQERNGVYQFSPVMPNGRWWKVEPNEECWKAVEEVNATNYDVSEGALYFEACSGESWHSRNLEFICEVDDTRFYK